MNLSSTEVICSRDTSLSSAIAIPSFWTSRASSCLSTFAASCSPKLISRMAARCVPASSSTLLAIRGDPILHDLCCTPRILPYQGTRCRDLLLKTGRQFDRLTTLSRKTHAIALEIAGVATAGSQPRRGLGQRFHQRPQNQKGEHQHQPSAHDLFRQLRDPWGLPQRQTFDGAYRRAALESLTEHIQLIAAILFQTDGFTHQLREALNVGVAHGGRGDFAVLTHFLPIIQHHADIEAFQIAD